MKKRVYFLKILYNPKGSPSKQNPSDYNKIKKERGVGFPLFLSWNSEMGLKDALRLIDSWN